MTGVCFYITGPAHGGSVHTDEMKTRVDTDVPKQRCLLLDSEENKLKRSRTLLSQSSVGFCGTQLSSIESSVRPSLASVNQMEEDIKKMEIKDPADRSSVSHTQKDRQRQTNQDSCPYRGLLNLGATCYLNSTLQVLFMTRAFRESVLRRSPGDTSEKFETVLKELFEELSDQDEGAPSVSTKPVIKALGVQTLYEQQDAVEYFLDILEKVGPDLAEVFSGTMRNKRRCSEDHESHDDSSFKSLQIALNVTDTGAYRIEDGVRSYFESTTLVGDDQMYCETCDEKRDTTWGCEIHKYPAILSLHLKRFEYDCWSCGFEKNDCPMDVPLHLSLGEHRYALYAVINHRGSRSGGHYTADIRSFTENRWYCFDDSHVTEIDERKLERSREAYLLLYQKLDSPPVSKTRKVTQNSARTEEPSSSVARVEDEEEPKTKSAEAGEPVETGRAGQCAAAHNKPHLEESAVTRRLRQRLCDEPKKPHKRKHEKTESMHKKEKASKRNVKSNHEETETREIDIRSRKM
ncbi:ubiquitin carboxyl-terminal hydrolase 47-like isoform X1 [Carassius gibelio]|uniref:ubiquitin carboxyl-terminal hydrolase 47 isoform X1 n=1 Tax=Carassius gibelio TaxID=101364 RepID=UPI0022788D77|nr:ubiquitin carboxyl-terminal hydrolase 47 isoform X1 [Carassius gibelio]XP_052395043.1 ubiquitin carboxyl-terminal hydrolase 47-like isoform X1 [Carassius gibelio]